MRPGGWVFSGGNSMFPIHGRKHLPDHQLPENPNGLFYENGMLLAGTANAVVRIDPDSKQAGLTAWFRKERAVTLYQTDRVMSHKLIDGS